MKKINHQKGTELRKLDTVISLKGVKKSPSLLLSMIGIAVIQENVLHSNNFGWLPLFLRRLIWFFKLLCVLGLSHEIYEKSFQKLGGLGYLLAGQSCTLCLWNLVRVTCRIGCQQAWIQWSRIACPFLFTDELKRWSGSDSDWVIVVADRKRSGLKSL